MRRRINRTTRRLLPGSRCPAAAASSTEPAMLARLRPVPSRAAAGAGAVLPRACCTAKGWGGAGREAELRRRAGVAVLAGCSLAAAAGLACDRAPPPAAAEERGPTGEAYQLPDPVVQSGERGRQLWERFGVGAAAPPGAGPGRLLEPQPSGAYRAFGPDDEARIRDMRGELVGAGRNPGIRVELNFMTEEEERALAEEVSQLVAAHGSVMGGARSYASAGGEPVRLVLQADGSIVPDPEGRPGPMWRVTGRAEDSEVQRLPPWGYGASFVASALPPCLAAMASRIAGLEGYPLGPLRDVTLNLRTSSVCRLDPHVDPLEDGPNGFILTLLSGAVLTFSPVEAVRADPERAGDPAAFGMRSFTDADLDCLLRRRSLCHFSGAARYRWAHAIRPGVAVELRDEAGAPRACICDWWGTTENLLERRDERISIVFSFADPYFVEPGAPSEERRGAQGSEAPSAGPAEPAPRGAPAGVLRGLWPWGRA